MPQPTPKYVAAVAAAAPRLPTNGVLAEGLFQKRNNPFQNFTNVRPLSQGTYGTTYVAETGDGREVLIKELNYRSVTDPKGRAEKLKEIECEVQSLKYLDHEAIPKIIDSFSAQIDNGIAKETRYYIVQEYIPNSKTLQEWITEGKPFTEQEIIDIGKQALAILIHLQGFVPPMLHRDISPNNLLLDENGKIYLIDFGSAAMREPGSMSVAGTYDYMAPEAFQGRYSTATENFSLGAVLIRLLTRGDLSKMRDSINDPIEFKDRITIKNAAFANWLERMADTDETKRIPNAEEALKSLELSGQNKLVLTSPEGIRNALIAAGYDPEAVGQALGQLSNVNFSELTKSGEEYEKAVKDKVEEIKKALVAVFELMEDPNLGKTLTIKDRFGEKYETSQYSNGYYDAKIEIRRDKFDFYGRDRLEAVGSRLHKEDHGENLDGLKVSMSVLGKDKHNICGYVLYLAKRPKPFLARVSARISGKKTYDYEIAFSDSGSYNAILSKLESGLVGLYEDRERYAGPMSWASIINLPTLLNEEILKILEEMKNALIGE